MPILAEYCNFGERCHNCPAAGLADTTRSLMGRVVEAAEAQRPDEDILWTAQKAVHDAVNGTATHKNPVVIEAMSSAAQRIASSECSYSVRISDRTEIVSFFRKVLNKIRST